MAQYNSHLPRILGNEYSGIRDEDLIFDPLANSYERGYGFTLGQSRTINSVRSYIHELPDGFVANNAITANIYPRGMEDASGPVRKVIIPCNNGIVTGDAFGGSNSFTYFGGATTVPTAFWNPSADSCISYRVGQTYNSKTFMWFAVNQYAQLLYNKRILGVNFLVGVDVGSFVSSDGPNDQGYMNLYLGNDYSIINLALGGAVRYPDLFTPSTPATDVRLDRIRLGDVSRYFGVVGNASATHNNNIASWTYSELARFEASAANRINMQFQIQLVGLPSGASSVLINYAALEVFYCEETRVGFGSKLVQLADTDDTIFVPYNLGANSITTRDPAGGTLTLAAGDYTLTYNQSNLGDSYDGLRTGARTPKYNELRNIYQLNTVPGIQVNIPYPLNDEAIGTTLTSESTLLVPQLSMHTSNATLPESNGYGRIVAAQVWGTNTVTQEIYDDVLGVNTTFPWVRYYARRFGDTSVPLTLSSTLASGTSTVTITPAEFDALDEVVDGWKEVVLRFSSPPVMGTEPGSAPRWTWSATGELAGDRWEVLGVDAPGVSGVPGNNMSLAQGISQLYSSTYYAAATTLTPAFIAAGTAAHANNASVTPTMPAGIVTGNTLLVLAAIRNSGTGTVNVPTGYTLLLQSGNFSMFGKIYDGTETAPTITFSNGVANASCSAQMCAFSGLSLEVLPGASGQLNGSAQNIAYPGITTTETSVVFWLGWKQDDWTSVDTLGGTAEIGDPSTTLGDDQGIVWDFVTIAASVLSAGSFTVNGGASAISRGANIALRPATTGGEIELTWLPQGIGSPWVSGATADSSADAVLIFGQDMPTVTGFGVTTGSQAVTGIGLDCGISPCGIPTHILYNQLAWGLPVNTGIASDTFNRTVVDGMGTADVGGSYTTTGLASVYDVSGGKATIAPAISTGDNFALLTAGPDFDTTVTIGMQNAFTGSDSLSMGVAGRYTNANNKYYAYITIPSSVSSSISLNVSKTVAGVLTTLYTVNLAESFITRGLGSSVRMRFMGFGTYFKVKIWDPNEEEPEGWNLEFNDSSLTTGNLSGFFFSTGTSAANVAFFQNLVITPPQYWFGYYELQRSDTITDWQTIMKATSPAVTGFRDYEARIGMSSSYRIRGVSVYDFTGPWSSTVSIYQPAPGVSGSCLDDAHIMVFTTNEHQNGSSNLAYSNAWEGAVQEAFDFPEAAGVQLQAMYDRDFFTAFHPLERGGEQFSRAILVQAAAISPETLADFTSLRSMAWAAVPYICVRDEDGNRWFASVTVPSGLVRNRRMLYTANIQITEVTDTAAEIDP